MKFSESIKRGLGLALGALMLSACGGGGGGGGDDELTYSGVTTPARITSANAPDLTASVVGVYGVFGDLSLDFRSEQAGDPARPDYLRFAMKRIADIRKNQVNDAVAAAARVAYRAETVDETEDCAQGKIRIFGSIDDIEGTGVLTFRFENCALGGVTFDGDVVARIDAFDIGFGLPIQLGLTFKKLRITAPGADVSIGGSASYAVNVVANEENETIVDMVIADNVSGRMQRIVNLVSVHTYNDIGFPSQVTVDIRSGRVFDSRYGYVDVQSTVVITFGSISQDFPDAGVYLLSADGSIVATALNSTQVQIQADTDPNVGGFEFDETLNWADL